jgi:hypothetical protein
MTRRPFRSLALTRALAAVALVHCSRFEGTAEDLGADATAPMPPARDGQALPPGTVVWPENGHGYLLVVGNGPVTWTQAKIQAEQLGGHLVTVTSAAEETFVEQVARPSTWSTITKAGPWIGAYQEPGSVEPRGGWRWVTSEPWAYTDWAPGEPNDLGGREDFGFLVGPENAPAWGDVVVDNFALTSFLVEFE